MTIQALDHVNLRTASLDAMVAFYTEVLGLEVGARPAFPFPGAWLYAGKNPVVHLVVTDTTPKPEGELSLEHFAFSASDMEGFLEKLHSRGIEYRIGEAPGFGIQQVNLYDPDGNHLHVDFMRGED